MTGALAGLRIVELGALGPAPYAAQLLADHGADVLRVERADRVLAPGQPNTTARHDVNGRNRPCAGIDLKHPDGVALVRCLCADADGLIEGMRPGVLERLGLDPDELIRDNPRLVIGRMTGWGQDGPWADHVGHDLNYLSVTGALHAIGPADGPPPPPLNLVGDFGGGGLLLAFGMVMALLAAQRSGDGQVVDAAMVDGVASQLGTFVGMTSMGLWVEQRESNFLDGGAHFYRCYECADGEHVAVAAIEPQFYAALLGRLGLDGEHLPDQHDRSAWPAMRDRLAAVFRTRPRDAWAAHFDGHSACVTPVLRMSESWAHPHHVARGTFVDVDGAPQPAPAPRLSRTPGTIRSVADAPGQHTDEALAAWGVPAPERNRLRETGAIA